MQNLYILLMDSRGRVLWALSEREHPIQGRVLSDLVFEDDRERVEECLARCIIKGEVVEFTARWHDHYSDAVGWTLSLLRPIDPPLANVAALSIHKVLPANHNEFSNSDRELLGLLADDHNIKDAANTVDRSESAIDARIKNLKSKLGKHTLPGLVAAAIRGSLVPMTTPTFGSMEQAQQEVA